MMQLRLVVMGVSGCGKSTFAAALAQRVGAVYRDADDLHSPENIAKMKRGEALDDADRAPWLDLCGATLTASPRIVLACSALRRTYRDHLRRFAPDLKIVHLAATQADIAARLQLRRDHFMPPGLLASQYATLEPPAATEALTLDAMSRTEALVEIAVVRLGLA